MPTLYWCPHQVLKATATWLCLWFLDVCTVRTATSNRAEQWRGEKSCNKSKVPPAIGNNSNNCRIILLSSQHFPACPLFYPVLPGVKMVGRYLLLWSTLETTTLDHTFLHLVEQGRTGGMQENAVMKAGLSCNYYCYSLLQGEPCFYYMISLHVIVLLCLMLQYVQCKHQEIRDIIRWLWLSKLGVDTSIGWA
jgi:hypothetical protein